MRMSFQVDDPELYTQGGNVYVNELAKFTTPTGLDKRGLERDLSVLDWEVRAAVRYFVSWNANHKGAFEEFLKNWENEPQQTSSATNTRNADRPTRPDRLAQRSKSAVA
jgi:membrane protein required for beta-lactamase induction